MRTISCFLSRLALCCRSVRAAQLSSPHETVLIDRILSVGRFGHIISERARQQPHTKIGRLGVRKAIAPFSHSLNWRCPHAVLSPAIGVENRRFSPAARAGPPGRETIPLNVKIIAVVAWRPRDMSL
jgi:hypothetical protein